MNGSEPDPDWAGGDVSERAHCVLCPNPSPMTLDGTNTWVLGEPGSDAVVVVEPARIVADHEHGMRSLYVALTRPTQRLSIVHADDLPEHLR